MSATTTATTAAKTAREARRGTLPAARPGLLYAPLDFVLVRTPLLPVSAYLELHGRDSHLPPGALSAISPPDEAAARPDALIGRALVVASGALAEALERPELQGRSAARRDAKLLRYRTRMSTRPTPYGLFAGVALGTWGPATDLELAAAPPRTRTRPDMGWLMALVMSLEVRPEVRRCLHLVADPTAIVRAGRVFLAERAPGPQSASAAAVSVRATGVALRALALARRPVPYSELRALLLAETPGATSEVVDALLDDLWQQTLLLTDLRPPLTGQDPARYVAERLARIPAARDAADQLGSLLAAVANCDVLPPDEDGAAAYRRLVEQARSVSATESETPFQVDMALELAGHHISSEVAAEAARAVELLLRLTPLPSGLPHLAAYRQAFEARYGVDREVPLLELLDPAFGLGPPATPGRGIAGGLRRARMLLDLAFGALRDRRLVGALDEHADAALETWAPAPATAPPSLDVYAFVAAPSREAVDEGNFQLVVGPNLGAMAAGRNLGRFADLLGTAAAAALERAARAEEAHEPTHIAAELTYLPWRPRAANVAVRPAVRHHEITLAVSPGVAPEHVIRLDELMVGVREGRFYVRWPAEDAHIAVCAGHMLNTMAAPAVCRFLSEISRDGVAHLSAFDWGPATGFPFLPRIQVGRIVLRPAEWRIDGSTVAPGSAKSPAATFHQALARWRTDWQVPRYVYLSAGDNRLLLDLEDESQVDELRSELRHLREGGQLSLQEALPGVGQAWVPGPGGRYAMELVVSLVRQGVIQPSEPEQKTSDDKQQVGPPARARGATAPPLASPALRVRPPGSEWLYAKLYGPRALEDDLIAGPIRAFGEAAVAAGLADHWFFLRYADPDPHIRLRFYGTAERMADELMPELCAWASALIADGRCLRLSFDTYDRELERYGGPAGTAVAERLFCADSRAVANLLALIQARALSVDRTTLAVLTGDDLLSALGLTEAARLGLYREQIGARNEFGQDYRQRKAQLRSLLGAPPGDSGRHIDTHAGDGLGRVLRARRRAVAPAAAHLADLLRRGELAQTIEHLGGSFVHLHCNRQLGVDRMEERRVLGLLARTRDGLDRAPLRNVKMVGEAAARAIGGALATSHMAGSRDQVSARGPEEPSHAPALALTLD